jgi:hypothetical protein
MILDDDKGNESNADVGEHPIPPEQEDLLWAGLRGKFTAQRVEQLLTLAIKQEKIDSPLMATLKGVSPGFKGDFVNFKLKDAALTEMTTNIPETPPDYPFVDIQPVKRPMAKDAAEVRAMDVCLTEVAKNLQASIKILLTTLVDLDADVDDSVAEGMFRGLCLTANAFARLQIERHTTPILRTKITDAAASSEVPEIVRKAKKQTFFRGEAGGAGHPSSKSQSDDDDMDEPMRPKRRSQFGGSQRMFTSGQKRKRSRSPRYGWNRFYTNPRSGDPRFSARRSGPDRAPT